MRSTPPRVARPPKRDFSSPHLISVVRKFRVLWDPKYPGYHLSTRREEACEKVATYFWAFTGLHLLFLLEIF